MQTADGGSYKDIIVLQDVNVTFQHYELTW